MTPLENLTASVKSQPDVRASIERLLHDLAARMKATSNDQNVQKLARDLEAAAPALVSAITDKTAVG